MRTDFCMVCHDPAHLNTKIYDVQRIINFIGRYTIERMITDTKLFNNLQMDRAHVHFMCGNCWKADEARLRREEEHLYRLVYAVCMDLREGKSLPVWDILRQLQGYYPLLWKCVDREIRNIHDRSGI